MRRQAMNKQYIDQFLATIIHKLAVDTLNAKPNVPAAYMRDNLLGIEHKNVEVSYTSISDLKQLREEVANLRLRKRLLSQIWDGLQTLQLDNYRDQLDEKILLSPLT